ncbi:hypothetical protein TrRE_jg12349 [Triparma retinervis]|uniref:Uncharacterized protein n=1 Tax=Triparma retinervis TaxID=2557542 RepID=A0A9W6Z3E8_9STRA|nr:hypothetical protein TrRE_jg12349 [Triparma retinervis]
MPFPLCARECIIRRSVDINGDTGRIITRTHPGYDPNVKAVKTSPLRVMADIHIAGYYLESISTNRTRVTYLMGCDLNGVFSLDWMARRAGAYYLKKIVDWTLDDAKSVRGGGEEGAGMNAKKKYGLAFDMGSIFGGDKDVEEGSFEMTNTWAKAGKKSTVT